MCEPHYLEGEVGGSLVIPVPPPHTTFLVRQEAATSLGQVLIVREGGTGILLLAILLKG